MTIPTLRKLIGQKLADWAKATRLAAQRRTNRIALHAEQLETRTAPAAASPQLLASYGQLPLSFEPNVGQTAPQVQYLARGDGYSLYLTPTSAVLDLQQTAAPSSAPPTSPDNPASTPAAAQAPNTGVALAMNLVGANAGAAVTGLDDLPGTVNYFIGNDPSQWHTGIATYSEVEYQGIYPGINLLYDGTQGQMEYDFMVAPGANPGLIQFDVQGADSVSLDDQGNLVLQTASGNVVQHAPVLYQQVGNTREPVSGQFVLQGNNQVGFQVGAYDAGLPLTIDPVLTYNYVPTFGALSTFITVDGSGNAYITGLSSDTLPTTAGAFQTQSSFAGGTNGVASFVAKLNASGTALIYCTYLGGNDQVESRGIALDDSGNAYVIGVTNSTNFPTTAGAFQTTYGGTEQNFLTKLNANGTALVYSTYMPGNVYNETNGNYGGKPIAVDGSGNAYITGITSSANFPVTSGAFQTSLGGATNAFVIKLNATGTGLIYSTFLGGSGADQGLGIAVDASDSAFITGETSSANFPVTSGAFQASLPGSTLAGGPHFDAFVTKLNAAGTGLIYSTFLGGSTEDEGIAIAVDASDNAYITGIANSANFPITAGAFQTTGFGAQAFVAKLNDNATALDYSTFLGSNRVGGTFGNAIAIDASGNAYVTGYTAAAGFPTTPGAFQTNGTGAFLAAFNATGTALNYSTYLEGSSGAIGMAIAVNGVGNAYVSGFTGSKASFVIAFAGLAPAVVPTSHFTVGGPASTTAGSAFNITVTAKDSNGNTLQGYTGTVHFSSSDGNPNSVLPADYTFVPADSGVHVFTGGANLVTATAKATITVTDTSASGFQGSATISAAPAAATSLMVTAPGLAITAGNPFTIDVTAEDTFGNTATGYSGTVGFTSSDPLAVLPANATLKSGMGKFSVTLKTAGGQTITATDTATSSIAGKSWPITIIAGAATQFTVTAPASVAAGSPFHFTVTAMDSFSNTALGYSGTIHFASTDPGATLPADATLTSGVGTFSATLVKLGSDTVTATDTTTGSITDVSGAINVNPGGVTQFAVTAPASVAAGSLFDFTVTAEDAFANAVPGYSGTIHFAGTDPGAALPADATLTSGVGTFSATLVTTGSQTISVTDTANHLSSSSAPILVTPAANHFTVNVPKTTTMGNGFVFTVTAIGTTGNPNPAYTGTVHFSSTDPLAGLPADTALFNGTGVFAAVLNTLGTQTISVDDSSVTSDKGTSGAITVVPPATASFSVAANPHAISAGSAVVLEVTALDARGNIIPAFSGTVHFSSSDAQASLPADATLTNGIGFFSAILKTAGRQSLFVSDLANGGATGTSAPITVTTLAATHFGVSAPTNAVTGNAFAITVTALDPYGNIAPTFGGTVHFSSSDSAAGLPPDSTLSGGSGVFSATLATSGNQTLTATDTASGINGVSAAIAVRGMIVTGLVPTPNGFAATFDKPFDPTTLSLYSAPDDVLLVNGTGHSVRGSLVLNTAAGAPPDTSFTFVATSGVLAAGTYTVTLVSGSSGIKDPSGVELDGTDTGNPGNNYVTTFTVAATPSVVLSIPDFARGPNSTANILLPNNTGSGIPITLTGAANLIDITFNLTFNPALLNISGTLNGPSGAFTLQSNTGGVASFAFQSSTPLNGTITLGYVLAQVPNSAATSYKSKALLHLGNIVINGSSTTAINDDAIEAMAYLGDVAGTGSFSPLDAALIGQVAVGIDTGFSAFEQLDPAIIGNATNSGATNSSDVTLMNRLLAGIAAPQVPLPPAGLVIPPTGPDPTLSLGPAFTAAADGAVTVPVNIDTARPAASSGLMEATLALRFNPLLFSVTAADIKLGTIPSAGSGWQLDVAINQLDGRDRHHALQHDADSEHGWGQFGDNNVAGQGYCGSGPAGLEPCGRSRADRAARLPNRSGRQSGSTGSDMALNHETLEKYEKEVLGQPCGDIVHFVELS